MNKQALKGKEAFDPKFNIHVYQDTYTILLKVALNTKNQIKSNHNKN